MPTQMIVRIDPELKSQVTRFAQAEGKNVSVLVRELLEAYVKNRDMSGHIDALWNRIGTKMRRRNVCEADIAAAVRAARAGE